MLEHLLIGSGAFCAFVGTINLALGWRGPRVDDHPRCRRCRYDLSGIDVPNTCPECGRALTRRRAIRVGRRRRRPVWLGLGVLSLLTGLSVFGYIGFHYARSVDWDPYKPTAWLISDLRNGRLAAWNEVRRRQDDGALSVDQTVTLVGIARNQIAMLPGNRPWRAFRITPFIVQAWLDGHASDADLGVVVRRLTLPLSCSRLGRAGGSIGYSMTETRFGAGWRHRAPLRLVFTVDRVTMDGQSLRHWGALPAFDDPEFVSGVVYLPEDAAGDATLTFHLSVTATPEDRSTDRRWTGQVTAGHDVLIDWFPEEPIDEVEADLWPSEYWPLRKVSGRLWRDMYGHVRPAASLWLGSPPAPSVAFDVFWRIGDEEVKVESFTYAARERRKQQYFLATLDDLDPSITHVDVIYRSNRALANMHAGLETMWVGELRWEDVEVVWPE